MQESKLWTLGVLGAEELFDKISKRDKAEEMSKPFRFWNIIRGNQPRANIEEAE